MNELGEAPRALVLQHLACEDPGALRGLLTGGGLSLHTVELDEGEAIPDLLDFDLLLVMGGPMNVWEEEKYPWLVAEKAAIRYWVEILRRPYLGVCLGHQLLADAMGGVVGPMAVPEIGVCPIGLTPAARHDALFSALPAAIGGLQWHEAEIRTVPPGATVLATNAACAVQAFRAAPGAWGVQFHVEVLDSTVEKWAQVPEYRDELERSGIMDADTLRRMVADQLPAMEQATAALAQRLVATTQTLRGVRGGTGIGPP